MIAGEEGLDESIDIEQIASYAALAQFRIGVISGFANREEIDSLPAACKREYADTGAL